MTDNFDSEIFKKQYKPLSYIPNQNGKYIKTSDNVADGEKIALQQIWDSINENVAIQKKKLLKALPVP